MFPDTAPPFLLLGYLLFTLMGPIAAIPTFAASTVGAPRDLKVRIALAAALISLIAIAVAVLLGAGAMEGVGTSKPSLIMAAGLILLLTALRNIFADRSGCGARAGEPHLGLAISPIAVPGLVPPFGVAIVIIFVSYFPAHRFQIFAIVCALMVINLAAMLVADWFMRRIGMAPLVVLGAVFGVLQAALGIEMIVSGVMRSTLMN